jgi:hypothetical protein
MAASRSARVSEAFCTIKKPASISGIALFPFIFPQAICA